MEERTAGYEDVILISNLTKKYGKKVAVDNLTLNIRRGEIFGLLGPNGAGKTTTILMLLGLTEPTYGDSSILGMSSVRNPLGVKSKVGYLPDNTGFYTDMTGRQNLRFTGHLNGLSGKELESRIEELLEKTGLTYAGDQKTGTYSKGMRQRLGIADVLMKDPEIIIMDEPTLGIDPEGMRELLTMIRSLSVDDGKTILISSHQLQQIQQVCDRVGIFVNGKLIASGTLGELEEHIREDSGCLIQLQVDPKDDQVINLLREKNEIISVEEEGDYLRISSQNDIRSMLTGFLGGHGYSILELHQKGGDLDEIYRRYFQQAEAEEKGGVKNAKRSFGKRRKGA